MSQLTHPNLVTFREIFEGPEHFFVVLELVTGGELFDRIIELQRYSEKDAVHVMCQALAGLKHMHDKKIAHRDLKPENLLLSSKEPGATVKVADFGFATKVTTDHELLQLVGTPPYFAPELSALRDETVNVGYGRPVDVWSMGVILYILLSGIHPFQIADEDLMLDNIQNGKWNWVGPNWPRISAEAKDLIVNMMTLDPNNRYTIDQCLTHTWMTAGMASSEDLSKVADEIKKMQAKKRLKAMVNAVLAQQRMKRLLALRPAPPKQRANKLVIKIIQGRNLVAKDSNGKSDPYITVIYGQLHSKTKHEKKTLDPVWKDHASSTIIFPVHKENKNVLLECWDFDLVGGHDFMGEVIVDISDIPEDGVPVRKWYELGKAAAKDRKKKTKTVSGAIEVEFSKTP